MKPRMSSKMSKFSDYGRSSFVMSLGASPSKRERFVGSPRARGVTKRTRLSFGHCRDGEVGRGNPWPMSRLKGDFIMFI